jgi:hypothetical protein
MQEGVPRTLALVLRRGTTASGSSLPSIINYLFLFHICQFLNTNIHVFVPPLILNLKKLNYIIIFIDEISFFFFFCKQLWFLK